MLPEKEGEKPRSTARRSAHRQRGARGDGKRRREPKPQILESGAARKLLQAPSCRSAGLGGSALLVSRPCSRGLRWSLNFWPPGSRLADRKLPVSF